MKYLNSLKIVAMVFTLALAWSSAECFAAPDFYSTSNPENHWFVSTVVNHSLDHDGNGQQSSFNTGNFIQAVSIAGRGDYIANNNTGSNGYYMGDWTYFVFRQTFDLAGYNPASANLQFQWAADDSGQGGDRGTWIPKFSLNGGAFTNYPGSPTETYGYSSELSLTEGFLPGLNTIDFYVEGNGITDGFALKTVDFKASTVTPEPVSATLFLLGGGLMALKRYRRKK